MASIHDGEGTAADVPDGWKVDPKRTSFVEVGALKDQRSSLAISLVSSTASSQHLKLPDIDEDEATIDESSTPGSKHSSATLYVSSTFIMLCFGKMKKTM